MKTILSLSLLLSLVSCSSLTVPMAALNMASKVEYENPKRPDFHYKQGDKMKLWSAYVHPVECEVLYASSNPYSDQNMVAKYEVKCPGAYDTKTVTSEDLKRNEVYKEAFLKSNPNWEKELEASRPKYKPDYKIGDSVTYYDTHEDTTRKCIVSNIDDDGLGKSHITYSLKCDESGEYVHANASLLKAGRKIASDRAAGKGITREQSFKETVKKTFEQRKEVLKNLAQ